MSAPALQAVRLGRALASRLPPGVSRRLAEAGAVALVRTLAFRSPGWSERRRILARHLERVVGVPATSRMVDEAVASYGRYWAESLRLPDLDVATLAAGMAYDGLDRIDAALSAGRGVILSLPHLGGWEWAGAHLATTGRPVSVVVERLEPPELFEWFVGFRRKLGMNVIAAGPEAAARCAQALASNHVLCLLADRLIEGAAGVEVEFFAERTLLPAGPAALAIRSGAPVLPCAVYFEQRTDAHLGVVLEAVDTSRQGRVREDVARITQALARRFEELIRRAPTQWHLMQANWPSDADPASAGAGPVGSRGRRSRWARG
ncbi:MAG TPA: phosphatidylinositol mannoside acyltransferase [Acidimicrobiales bacterium]|nr:phosphatidylinositol mannoside acyltransferase [Acidimicrobiales bacterium]